MTRTVDFEALPSREKIIKRVGKPVANSERSSKAWQGKRERKVVHRCAKVNQYLCDE